MLYEDLHWADPTSLEVLDLLIDRVRTFPLLIVLTYRPEFQSRWGGHGHVAALNLSKLTRAQSSAMISKLAGSKALPAELMNRSLPDRRGAAVRGRVDKSFLSLESVDIVQESASYVVARPRHHDSGDAAGRS